MATGGFVPTPITHQVFAYTFQPSFPVTPPLPHPYILKPALAQHPRLRLCDYGLGLRTLNPTALDPGSSCCHTMIYDEPGSWSSLPPSLRLASHSSA